MEEMFTVKAGEEEKLREQEVRSKQKTIVHTVDSRQSFSSQTYSFSKKIFL